MTAGTNDKKKLTAAIVLGVAALYGVYKNLLAGPSVPTAPAASTTRALPPPAIAVPTAVPGEQTATKRAPSISRAHTEEFHPPLHSKRPEDQIDPRTYDPTLKLDLLKRVQAVEPAGGTRNLFQVGPPPPKPAELLAKAETKVFVPIGPVKPPDKAAAVTPPPPPVLPITLKYYGISMVRTTGRKTACFMDGDDILTAAEGDTLKRRYKVVRINPNSVVMEDTESKRQQTLPLAEEAQG